MERVRVEVVEDYTGRLDDMSRYLVEEAILAIGPEQEAEEDKPVAVVHFARGASWFLAFETTRRGVRKLETAGVKLHRIPQ